MVEVAKGDIKAATILRLSRGVWLREDVIRQKVVLLAPEKAIALDDIATAIIASFDGERSVAQIADDLASHYEAPKEQVLSDIMTFASQFMDRGLLEIANERSCDSEPES